jgi:hypothetical protein
VETLDQEREEFGSDYQVNRIKMLKRQMYGRARFSLLRKRVILHPG